ncbi:organic cation transporter-like protein isoform X2 [Nematostella vectensis]|uniref:organic cation transporter-like protein isoform X2 n=1 Tax=Nematostella vectensis TaxID=45351 RepID=UPI0013902578|nr:organic cation transporter-like protein isoform X2 [Nematostella vectensis]
MHSNYPIMPSKLRKKYIKKQDKEFMRTNVGKDRKCASYQPTIQLSSKYNGTGIERLVEGLVRLSFVRTPHVKLLALLRTEEFVYFKGMDDIKTKTSKTKAHNRMFDDVFDHVNQFSRYQALVYHGVSALCIFPMSLPYSNVLWAMGIPEYHCKDANTTCLPNECCDNCTSYAYDGPFFSTASEWNLICEKAPISAAVQMTMFVGMLFTSIVVGPLSDRFGRKICIFASMAVLVTFFFNSDPSFSSPVFFQDNPVKHASIILR